MCSMHDFFYMVTCNYKLFFWEILHKCYNSTIVRKHMQFIFPCSFSSKKSVITLRGSN